MRKERADLDKKQKIIVATATSICLAAVIVMVAALCIPKVGKGKFTPPPFERTAVEGIPTVPEGLGWQELDAKAFQVGICGKFIVTEGSAEVWLTNPEDNAAWLKLRVTDTDGNILGETGILRQGEYVRSVALDTALKEGTPIVLKIMAYEPETYYSQGAVTLNTTVSAVRAD